MNVVTIIIYTGRSNLPLLYSTGNTLHISCMASQALVSVDRNGCSQSEKKQGYIHLIFAFTYSQYLFCLFSHTTSLPIAKLNDKISEMQKYQPL